MKLLAGAIDKCFAVVSILKEDLKKGVSSANSALLALSSIEKHKNKIKKSETEIVIDKLLLFK